MVTISLKVDKKTVPYFHNNDYWVKMGNFTSNLEEMINPLSNDKNTARNAEPDLVLIYRIYNQQLQLARIGSHSDLF